MDFDDLTHFAVLAEELNFRRAAQRLDVRQPTLTRRIRRLEQELGVYLLERHARRINLTRAGEIFAERSQHLIDEQAKLTSEIAQAATGSFGELSIGFYTSLASEILMPVLREFARTSDVRINLFEKTPRHQVRDLRDGSIDLALVIGGMPDEDLNAEGLWIERLVLALPPEHRLCAASVIGWSDLVNENLISRSLDYDRSASLFIEDRAAQFGGFRPHMRKFAVTRENIVTLVRAGFGIAVLPESSARGLNMTDVHCRPIGGPGSTIEITGAWLPGNANPVLRRFLERITQVAAAHGLSPETPDPPA